MTTPIEQVETRLSCDLHIGLVTGMAGCIGSNLLESLLRLNQRVVGLVYFATGYQSNLDEVRDSVSAAWRGGFEFVHSDTGNLDNCLRVMTF